MALPIAHFAVAGGLTKQRSWPVLVFLATLSVAPDFDFLLVWLFKFPTQEVHRTWSHSIPFALLVSLLWPMIRPRFLKGVSAPLFFAVLMSHGVIDLLCTLDASDHGVMLLWPFSAARFGWPVLVPLYLLFADSPFSAGGALRFTLLELFLAAPLFLLARTLRRFSDYLAPLKAGAWIKRRGVGVLGKGKRADSPSS